jgi:hypothetical protein
VYSRNPEKFKPATMTTPFDSDNTTDHYTQNMERKFLRGYLVQHWFARESKAWIFQGWQEVEGGRVVSGGDLKVH